MAGEEITRADQIVVDLQTENEMSAEQQGRILAFYAAVIASGTDTQPNYMHGLAAYLEAHTSGTIRIGNVELAAVYDESSKALNLHISTSTDDEMFRVAPYDRTGLIMNEEHANELLALLTASERCYGEGDRDTGQRLAQMAMSIIQAAGPGPDGLALPNGRHVMIDASPVHIIRHSLTIADEDGDNWTSLWLRDEEL